MDSTGVPVSSQAHIRLLAFINVPADGVDCVVCGVPGCLHILLWGLCAHHSH